MSRFTFPLFAIVALAIAPAFADGPASLKGVRTVYLNSDIPSGRYDITRALKRELPLVKVVQRMRDADAVIEVHGTPASDGGQLTTQATSENLVSYDSRSGAAMYDTRTYTVPVGQPTHNPGHAQGFLVRGNERTLLLDGLVTPAFATQTAARFIRAWREANP